MEGTPGIIPKTALVASKAMYYPFTVPQKLNDSATTTGKALNDMVGGVNAAVGNAYMSLEPKGPAKWLGKIFGRVEEAVTYSDQIAQRNKAVFWDPMSQGAEGIGRAIAGPGTYYYIKKAGIEQPTQDMIKGVLQGGLFKFPTAGEIGGGSGIGGSLPSMPDEAPAEVPAEVPAEAPAEVPAEAPAGAPAEGGAASPSPDGASQAAEGAGAVAA